METKKTTMLGAVLAVAIIAFAGVGYAATAYTATTTNTNNYLDSVYVEAHQLGNETCAYAGNFLEDVKFNTVNESVTIVGTESPTYTYNYTYTPVYTGVYSKTNNTYLTTGEVDDTNTFKAVVLSKELSLVVNPVGETAVTYNLNIAASPFTPDLTKIAYVMILKEQGTGTEVTYRSTSYAAADTTNNIPAGWHFNALSITEETTYTVQLVMYLVGGSTATLDNAVTGFASSTSGTKTTFTFTLDVQTA